MPRMGFQTRVVDPGDGRTFFEEPGHLEGVVVLLADPQSQGPDPPVQQETDEPTTGLHFEDVRVLLEVLHRLVDRGNTVVVIEHNLHVVKTADWVIDLGPEGGSAGGRILVEGTPETVAADDASYTGQHLAPLLR